MEKLWYLGKIWYYGKNYGSLPRTMELLFTMEINYGSIGKNYGTVVNYSLL